MSPLRIGKFNERKDVQVDQNAAKLTDAEIFNVCIKVGHFKESNPVLHQVQEAELIDQKDLLGRLDDFNAFTQSMKTPKQKRFIDWLKMNFEFHQLWTGERTNGIQEIRECMKCQFDTTHSAATWWAENGYERVC